MTEGQSIGADLFADPGKPVLNADLLLSESPPVVEHRWNARDTILYNLGIGFGAAAAQDEAALRFVLEEGLEAFPTMAAIMGGYGLFFMHPRFGIDFKGMLHGEESVELTAPLTPEGVVSSQARIEGVWDRGPEKGAVMRSRRELRNPASGALVGTVRSTVVMRFNGGFGGSAEGAPSARPLPERDPDGAHEIGTRPEQALIYRLSGDVNPLHSVPSHARAVGFPGPILHGLCSYAVAARALVAAIAGGDATRLTAYSARFSSPVYPGETLRTEYWALGDGEYAFRTRVTERDVIVLTGGRARFTG